jgi:CCR4-NOT transcriptional regulation complex NOT5 subunit
MEGDELYGDLEERIQPTSSSSEKPKQINIQKEREEILTLKQENENLKKENETLKRNIGILYRTAKLELDRKDGQLIQLEKDLQRLQR